MKDKPEYHGTPAELSELISREENGISDRMISRLLLQNTEELAGRGIRAVTRRSSGRRIIDLYADSHSADGADSDDNTSADPGVKIIDPVDPIVTWAEIPL